jgi:hypothetical protein
VLRPAEEFAIRQARTARVRRRGHVVSLDVARETPIYGLIRISGKSSTRITSASDSVTPTAHERTFDTCIRYLTFRLAEGVADNDPVNEVGHDGASAPRRPGSARKRPAPDGVSVHHRHRTHERSALLADHFGHPPRLGRGTKVRQAYQEDSSRRRALEERELGEVLVVR